MNSKSSTKISFYFRSESSVRNAVLKIKNLLISINSNSSNSPTIVSNEPKLENGIILTIYNPKLEVVFYKRKINLLNNAVPGEELSQGEDDLILSLHSMKEELYKSFTEIRVNQLSSSLKIKRSSTDIKKIVQTKGITITDVFLNLSYDDGRPVILRPPLDSYLEESTPKTKPSETSLTEMVNDRKEKDVKTKPVNTKERSVKHTKVEGLPTIIYKRIIPTTWRKLFKSKTKKSLATILLGKGYKPPISSSANEVTEPNLDNSFFNNEKVLKILFFLRGGIVLIFLSIYTFVISITGINILKHIFMNWLPFIHHLDVYSSSLENVLEKIINFFKYVNSNESSQSLKSDLVTPIYDNEEKPQTIETITEFVKDVMTNTVITLSDNMSTTMEAPRNNSPILNKSESIIIFEDETKEDNNNNNGYFYFMQKLFYVGVAVVAIDFLTGFPSNVTLNDPEIVSYLGDFVGGLVSITLVGISSLLQMVFGSSDNDKDKPKNQDKPDKLFFNETSNKERIRPIEYHKTQLALQDRDRNNQGLYYVEYKEQSSDELKKNKKVTFRIGGSSDNDRVNTILGFNQPSLKEISEDSVKIIKDVSKSGQNFINQASSSTEEFVKGMSDKGKEVIRNGREYIHDVSESASSKQMSRLSWDMSYTNLGLGNDKRVSPWGAIYTIPRKEDIKDGFVDSTIRFFKREGDNTFTREPNTGPLETSLKESDIPIFQLNDSSIDLSQSSAFYHSSSTKLGKEHVLEEFNSKRYSNPQLYYPTEEDIVILNNDSDNNDKLNIRIRQLEESIIHSTNNINSETKDEIKSLLYYYSNEIRTLYEIVDQKNYEIKEKDTHINMNESVIKFQENEIETLKYHDKEQENYIKNQEKNLRNSHLILTDQEEVIITQTKTLKKQLSIISTQEDKIAELRKSIIQCESALDSLTSSIQNSNGGPLLNDNDRKELIKCLITGHSNEEVKDRFEELKPKNTSLNHNLSIHEQSTPLQTNNKEKEVLTLYNGYKDGSITQPTYPSIHSTDSESSSKSTFTSRLPVRSSSLRK